MTETSSVPLAIEAADWSLGRMCADLVRRAAARATLTPTGWAAGTTMHRVKAALVVLVGLVLGAGMVTAGVWQFRVYQRQGAEAAAARAAEPPVPLSSVARSGAPVSEGYGRTVTFRGFYEPEHQVLGPWPSNRTPSEW